jgi:molecular chaperone GrpE
MERMRARLTTPPRGGLLTGDWKRQWASLHEGMDILSSHFRDLLAEAGVSRIQSEGKAFDPSCMMAVATKERDDLPDGSVAEEVTPGYRHGERVVKYAEVTVARNRREG